jgi:thymidylate kinase
MRSTRKVQSYSLPDPGHTPETPFLVDLFSALNASGIDYCVLRNYEGLPYDLQGSDLDILVSPQHLSRSIQIVLATARQNNGFAIWREWNDYLRALFHCSGMAGEGNRWGVHIDLFTANNWRGLDYYPCDQVLSRSVYRNGIRVADGCDANLIAFLSRLLHTGGTHKDYLPRAAAAFGRLTEQARLQISETFGKHMEVLIRVLETQDLTVLEAVAKKLRRKLLFVRLLRSPFSVLRNRLHCLCIHLGRVLRRPGIFVAVIGPDGAGKTTLIESARQDFRKLIHIDTEIKYLRPGLLPWLYVFAGRSEEKEVVRSEPHAGKPSGTIGSLFRLAYYTVDYLLGYWINIFPVLVKRATVIFFDRYFYDYYVDPTRWKIRAPWWLVGIFGRFIPCPDLVIMLHVEPEIVHWRKQELPVEELRRQTEQMRKVAERLKNVVWIDNSRGIDPSRREVLKEVLETFRRRPGWHSRGSFRSKGERET